jgi:DNA-binding Xre family transcriptional regulator
MASREASKEGKELINKQRKQKGWKYKDERWAIAAGKVLSPNLDWEQQAKENAFIAVSESTLGRFQRGKPIRPDSFNALCQALSLDANMVATVSNIDQVIATKLDSSSVNAELLIDMPKNDIFYGREAELKKIDHWLVNSSIPLLNIWGSAGIGKSTLMSQWVKQQTSFSAIIWQQVDCANESPELSHRDFMEKLLVLAKKSIPSLERTENLNKDFDLLLFYHRVLIVIVGNFDESYRQWFQRIVRQEYTGRVVIISEADLGIVFTENEKIKLTGLQTIDIKHLWQHYTKDQSLSGFNIKDNSFQELGRRCDGNPALLRLVIESIKNIYNGNLCKAMDRTAMIPKPFKEDFLDKAFNARSSQEQQILRVMAEVEDWVSIDDIKALTEQIVYTDDLDTLQKHNLVQVKAIDDEPRYAISLLWRKYLQRNVPQNQQLTKI